MTAACITTWVVAGLVAVVSLVSLVGTLVPGARDAVRDQVMQAIADSHQQQALADAGVSIDQLVTIAQVLLVVVLVWALAAVLLAVLAYRGAAWARVVLIVSASFAGLLGLLGALGAIPLLFVTLACVFVVGRLLARPVSRWYAARQAP